MDRSFVRQGVNIICSNMTVSSPRKLGLNPAKESVETAGITPTDRLWVYPDGRMIVAPASEKGGPDVGRQGEFKVFTPGGGDNAE